MADDLSGPEGPSDKVPDKVLSPDRPEAVKSYKTTIYSEGEISAEFGEIVEQLEALLGMKLWLLVQNALYPTFDFACGPR